MKKNNKNISIKPVFWKIFFSRFFIFILLATVIFLGIISSRYYFTKRWMFGKGDDVYSDKFTDFNWEYQQVNDTAYNIAYESDDVLKYIFPDEQLTDNLKEKIYMNYLKCYYAYSGMGNDFVYDQHLYVDGDQNDLLFSEKNSLFFSLYARKARTSNYFNITYEYDDDYISEQIDELRKKIDKFSVTTYAYLKVDHVYIKDDLTFLTDKIRVELYQGEKLVETYDINIRIPSRDELEKQGYKYRNLYNKYDVDNILISGDMELSVIETNQRKKSGIGYIKTNKDFKLYKSSKYSIDKKMRFIENAYYNFLIKPPYDGMTLWMSRGLREAIDLDELYSENYFYDQGAITNYDILKRDGIIIYSLVLFISIVSSVYISLNRKTLYEINTYRTELTNIMAHDIKTPLMVLRGNAENLTDIIGEGTGEKGEEGKNISGSIIRDVDRMNDLVNKTLRLSAMEAGTISIDKTSLNVMEVISDAWKKNDEIMTTHGITFDISGEDKSVKADEFLLKQAFCSLFNNSSKYVDENTAIRTVIKNDRLTVSYKTSAITKKNLKTLFSPFRNNDITGKDTEKSGMELVVFKKIIELHGWKVKAKLCDNTFILDIVM